MTVKQLEKIFYREPFRPYRIYLTDDEEVTVTKPRKGLVSGDQIAVVGLTRHRDGGFGKYGLRIVRIDRVLSVQDAEVDS